MAKNTEKAETFKKGPVTFLRKKVTAKIMKTADMKPGDTFRGKFVSQTERPWVDKTTGEEKIIPQFNFDSIDMVDEAGNPDRIVLLGDAGLKNAMVSAAVEPGDVIEIEKHEQVDLGGGRRANQYDIFQLTPQN